MLYQHRGREGSLAAALQLVADFAEELDIFRCSCRSFGLFFFLLAERVHGLDHEEDTEGDDEEVHSRLDEVTPVQLNCFLDSLASSIEFGRTQDVLSVSEAVARDETDGGMMMSLTSEVMILPKAPPMMIPNSHIQ